jgi:hypothetical protein
VKQAKPAPTPQPPRGFALRLKAEAAGRSNRNPRGGRRTRHRDLPLSCSGCPVFCLRQDRQAAAAKKQENRPRKKNKKTFCMFYIALYCRILYTHTVCSMPPPRPPEWMRGI